MSEQLTMVQIANELGLSRNAVSAVINNRARKFGLSATTEARIREYIDRSGYVQSRHALQIKTGENKNMVGLIYYGELPQYSHLQEALANLSNAIENRNGMVEITGIASAKVKVGIREQVAKRVDRLIWIMNKSAQLEIRNVESLMPLLERINHVVFYNTFMECDDREIRKWEEEYLRRGIHLVGFDRAPAFRKTADMLWDGGHRKIALNEIFFTDPKKAMPFTESLRKVFYDKGFEVFGLLPDNYDKISDTKLSIAMAENMRKLHDRHQVSCSFIRNDIQAIEVIFQLMKHGIRMPEDIAVVGYGGLRLSSMLPVPLTTFHPPVSSMCAKAMELIDAPADIPGQKWVYEDELIEGKTHGAKE